MIIAVATLLALGVGPAAYAEGEGGATATGLRWEAQNGNARVPGTEWFTASAAQRSVLSHRYAGVTFPSQSFNGQG